MPYAGVGAVARSGLRGLFLADPENVHACARRFFAGFGAPGGRRIRVADGNDRLATDLRGDGDPSSTPPCGIEERCEIIASVEGPGGLADLRRHLVCALPASTARDLRFEPSLPSRSRTRSRASATAPRRIVLQFGRRLEQARPAESAPFGAARWDGNGQQRGPRGILSFLGGTASENCSRCCAPTALTVSRRV